MKIWCSLFGLMSLCLSIEAQTDTITMRLVLIGDAGQLTNGRHPVVDAVRNLIKMDEKTSIIYLGDNLYKTGLPDEQYSSYMASRSVLDSELSVADNTPAMVYMIPGNHDWENGGHNGWETVIREQLYVDQIGKKNVRYYPEGGCPGPVEVSLSPDVTLVMFDTQWWIHPYDKPEIESDCDYKTKDEVITQLDDIFSRNAKKLIILAGHHTFRSTGAHGGYFTAKQHIFPFTDMAPNLYIPLPIIGSIYPIARSVFGSPQDLKHPLYADMINQVEKVAKKYPNVVFVAGHEHSLALIKDSSYNYIVSGGGSKHNRVSKSKKTHFATNVNGFAVLETSTNKNVRVSFYTAEDSVKMAYTEVIQNFSKIPTPLADSSQRKIEGSQTIKYKDTIHISGSEKYDSADWVRRLMVGTNYRKEWSTPVPMKVFNISTEKGGLKIRSLGGGKQTSSLTLVDPSGKEWKLRTIDKNPANAIPENFRNTLAADVVQDFISASHPYAPLAIPPMATALKLVTAHPELFFVPDDPSFGFYRPIFANTVCTLEEKEPSRHGEDTKSTIKVLDKLTEDHDHRADQPMVLQARLLDILIGDFDRHFDQWRWATTDTGKGKLYYPIPKDRDQAFFGSNGLMLDIASLRSLQMLRGFRYNIAKVNWFNWAARDFDRLFLNDLDADEWKKGIADFQKTISDSVIIASIRQLPPAIFKMDSAVLVGKLISRRNMMEDAGLKYYKFISKRVNVVGSNQKEYFKVTGIGKKLEVKVYARKGNNDTSFVMYDRVFDPRVTKDIRLYGLNDDDKFDIDPSARSRTRVSIIGGKGNDTFNIRGHVINYLYDLTTEKNFIEHRSRTRNLSSKEPPVNYYNILGFNYNINRFPRFNLGYNVEDGVFAGLGLFRRTYGFRNLPYATDQRFGILYAPRRGAYRIGYKGEFNHFFRNNDALINMSLVNPTLYNFYGLGNKTKIYPHDISFYRTRYNVAEAEMLFRRRFYERLHIMVGPKVFYYWFSPTDNTGRILEEPSVAGLDSSSVYEKKTYVGGKVALNFNNLNNELFPTRGVQWNTEFVSMAGVTKNSHDITTLTSDLNVYASVSEAANFIMVARFGGGHIFSSHYEYFQALNLGANNFLRGFRKTRFSGSSMAYNSIEARIKLVDVKSYLFPGILGLVLFNDVGRVWIKNESSTKWHDALGGGFYFIPFKLVLISATIAFSKEERLFNFSVGTKLNLTF
jgi:Omp85 superfamily domain/Calcineurin-like phosphoesterase